MQRISEHVGVPPSRPPEHVRCGLPACLRTDAQIASQIASSTNVTTIATPRILSCPRINCACSATLIFTLRRLSTPKCKWGRLQLRHSVLAIVWGWMRCSIESKPLRKSRTAVKSRWKTETIPIWGGTMSPLTSNARRSPVHLHRLRQTKKRPSLLVRHAAVLDRAGAARLDNPALLTWSSSLPSIQPKSPNL